MWQKCGFVINVWSLQHGKQFACWRHGNAGVLSLQAEVLPAGTLPGHLVHMCQLLSLSDCSLHVDQRYFLRAGAPVFVLQVNAQAI